MAKKQNRNDARTCETRRFVSERELAQIIGRTAKTLQKDRLFNRGFPFYRVFGQIKYDLNEVFAIIDRSKVA
jgi:hypothetical protein